MQPVPPDIEKLAPEGTIWYGGPVDRVSVSLRIRAEGDDQAKVAELLGAEVRRLSGHCSIAALDNSSKDLESQIRSILGNCTSDLNVWREVSTRWPMDMFCGLFLDRPNRGLELSVELMRQLSERGISLGLDIYADF